MLSLILFLILLGMVLYQLRHRIARALSRFFCDYAEDLTGHLREMRGAAMSRLHPKPAPAGAVSGYGATRPQPVYATRPAAVCRPLLKYVSIDAPNAQPNCVSLGKLPFKVGRAAGCDLSLADDTLSHEHFEIIVRGDSYGVRNLSQTNGIVLVNEETERIGTRLCESGRIQMIDPELGYLRFWAGGLFFQLSLTDSRAPNLM